MSVYQAIVAVAGELAQTGISKGRKNMQQNYSFRGIDDVYNTLAPIIAKHKLVILPRILTRSCVERTTAKGGVLFYVTVEAEFDFVSAVDGSKHTVRTFGEAMDSADKATNKAMSAAYKYAAFQTFCIPTEGDNDADHQTHEVVPRKQPEAISDAQRTDLVTTAQTHGWTNGEVRTLLKSRWGLESSREIPVELYGAIRDALVAGVDGKAVVHG